MMWQNLIDKAKTSFISKTVRSPGEKLKLYVVNLQVFLLQILTAAQ